MNNHIQETTTKSSQEKEQTIKRQLKDQEKNEKQITVLEEEIKQMGETIQ